MKIEIDVSSDTSTSQKLVIVSLPEASKLWEQLNDLFGAQRDYSKGFSGKQEDWEMPPVSCTADIGRTVWATDGAGNSLSPDELKARNRERNEKWAEIGDKFKAEDSNPAAPQVHVPPDYYTPYSGCAWRTFNLPFTASDLDLRSDSCIVIDGHNIHSLLWGNPYKVGARNTRWDCVNGFTE